MLTFANAAASVITTRKGALRVMPTRDEIQNLLGIISYRLYPEHYFGRKNTIFIGKVTGTAVFCGNVADRFDSYAVSGAFGGLENIVFFRKVLLWRTLDIKIARTEAGIANKR